MANFAADNHKYSKDNFVMQDRRTAIQSGQQNGPAFAEPLHSVASPYTNVHYDTREA